MSSTSDGLDPMGAAIAAIVIGGASGGALLSFVLLGSYWLSRGPDSAFARIVLAGAAAGLALSATVAFLLARQLGVWRRAVVAMVAAALTALLGVLTTAADMAAGRVGLAVLGALCLAAIAGARRVFHVPDKEP